MSLTELNDSETKYLQLDCSGTQTGSKFCCRTLEKWLFRTQEPYCFLSKSHAVLQSFTMGKMLLFTNEYFNCMNWYFVGEYQKKNKIATVVLKNRKAESLISWKCYCQEMESAKQRFNHKKVLLRERKRHTTHREAALSPDLLMGGRGWVPHPVLTRGIPHPVLMGGGGVGYPHPVPTWGCAPIQSSQWVPPILDLRWDTPCPGPEIGDPQSWTWDRGTTHQKDRIPPLLRCGLTHKVKILPSTIFRMRAAITHKTAIM